MIQADKFAIWSHYSNSCSSDVPGSRSVHVLKDTVPVRNFRDTSLVSELQGHLSLLPPCGSTSPNRLYLSNFPTRKHRICDELKHLTMNYVSGTLSVTHPESAELCTALCLGIFCYTGPFGPDRYPPKDRVQAVKGMNSRVSCGDHR